MRDVLDEYGLLVGSLLAAAVFSALVLALLPGCDIASPGGQRYVALGELVEVEEGGTVRLGPTGPYLTFREVLDDSRCPMNVDCVWQGQANAGFELIAAAGDTSFTMQIPGLVRTPYNDNKAVAVGRLTFTLLTLNPYPDAQAVEAQRSYRALIRVETDSTAQE